MVVTNSLDKKVSIIMTVKDCEKYLPQAIESVLNSSYQNIELVIWDDGSIDRSFKIAKTYSNTDSRISLFSDKHFGRAISLHRAIMAAKGIYIGIVDSDDLLGKEAISKTVNYLNDNPSVGLVYTQCHLINHLGMSTGIDRRAFIPYSKNRMLVDMMVFHFRLFKKEAYHQIKSIDCSLQAAVDYDLCLRLAEVTNITHLPEPLYYYRKHQNSISGSNSLTQAYNSEVAIRNALIRRGQDRIYELEVLASPKFVLKKIVQF